MMYINRRKVLFLLFVCIVLTIVSVQVFMTFARDILLEKEYVSIVTVKKGRVIESYSPILLEDLEIREVEKTSILEGSFSDTAIQKIIGKQSWITMADGEPILEWKLFDDKKLLPQKNEARYEIPIQDLTLMTEIRRGDFVKLWVSYKMNDPEAMQEQLGKPTFFKQTNASVDFLFESRVVGVKGSQGQEIFSMQPPELQAANELSSSTKEKQNGNEMQKRLEQTYRGQPSDIPNRLIFNWTDEQYRVFAEAQKYGEIQIGVFNKIDK